MILTKSNNNDDNDDDINSNSYFVFAVLFAWSYVTPNLQQNTRMLVWDCINIKVMGSILCFTFSLSLQFQKYNAAPEEVARDEIKYKEWTKQSCQIITEPVLIAHHLQSWYTHANMWTIVCKTSVLCVMSRLLLCMGITSGPWRIQTEVCWKSRL